MEKQAFLDFVAGVFEVDASTLSLETKYNSIPQWDSVMHLRLVMEIEAECDVEIPIDKVGELDTLGKFYDYVK